MNAKELIQQNNERRQLLTKDNLEYYENMLVYIRLSYNKSEQETEEVLTELLDHLLLAQEDGKTAQDVFGDDPKQAADEITGELPKMLTKERLMWTTTGILGFFGVAALFNGLISLIIFYVFGKGGTAQTVHLGSAAVQIVLSIAAAYILIFIMLEYLRRTAFRKVNKVLEFFIFWLFGALSLGLFVLIYLFVPEFGAAFELPYYMLSIIGAVLLLLSFLYGRLSRN